MIVLAYFHGMNDPLAKEVDALKGACEFLDALGEHRIDKAVILDLSTASIEEQTKQAMLDIAKKQAVLRHNCPTK